MKRLGQSDERVTSSEWSGQYVVYAGITIGIDKIARAAIVSLCISLTPSTASRMVQNFKLGTIKHF